VIVQRVFLRVILLAEGIFLLASPGMARPTQKVADAAIQQHLPILLKQFTYGNGTLTGTVINASLKEKPSVPDAQVCWGSNCVLSGDDGVYTLENVANGYQTLTASADGFVTADQVAYVVGNTVNYQDIAIITSVFESHLLYRILITWDSTPCWPDPNSDVCWPNDLDAHLWIEPPPLNYHIGYFWHYNPSSDIDEYWLDRGDCLGLFPNACLESDETDGYGPETLAIKSLEPDKVYQVGVFNYNQGQPGVPPISQTGAMVRLYDLSGLVKTYEVPTDIGDLNFWYVFKLDHTVEPPVITDENCIFNYSDNPPQCP
jgi:hypothetical protein